MEQQDFRRLAAVWFADIAGYTALSARDEDRALVVVRALQQIAREHVESNGGRIVKFVGDAVLAVFDSVDAALRSALAIQVDFGSTIPPSEAGLRIGVHLGEIVEAPDGDVYGDGVNTASRVEGTARPGQVVVTEAVFQQVRNRKRFELAALGERELKGLAEPIPTYLISNAGEGIEPALEGRYTILGELGRGGMATVYLASDVKHNRRVAIKVLHQQVASAIGPERFLREIEIVANLTHPSILPLHDSGSAGGHVFYVMPYVEGGSLRGRIAASGPFTLDESMAVAIEIADALRTAHTQGIVHRDLKPANILILEGHAQLADFGIAAVERDAEAQLTESGVLLGSPAYMSPEQAAGDSVDSRTDLYALGCILFEMLTGERAFSGSSSRATAMAHLARPAPSVASAGVEVPEQVEALIARCLAKDPDDRFQTAEELHGHLVTLAHLPGVDRLGAGTTPAAAALPSRARLTPKVAFGAVGVVGMLVAGAIWLDQSTTFSLASYAFAWAAVAAGIWVICDRTEEVATAEFRRTTARWLKGLPTDGPETWLDAYLAMFDRVFGKRHLSWRCFARSSFASLLTVAVLFALYFATLPNAVSFLRDIDLVALGWVVVWAGVLNFVPDYLSLLETRYLLRIARRTGRIVPMLVLDALVTTVIAFLGLALLMRYAVPLPGGQAGIPWMVSLDLPTLWDLVSLSDGIGAASITITHPGGDVPVRFGLFFYSSFITSAWLWLYALSGFAAAVAGHIGRAFNWSRQVLDVENRPFRSLGLISASFVSVLFAIALVPLGIALEAHDATATTPGFEAVPTEALGDGDGLVADRGGAAVRSGRGPLGLALSGRAELDIRAFLETLVDAQDRIFQDSLRYEKDFRILSRVAEQSGLRLEIPEGATFTLTAGPEGWSAVATHEVSRRERVECLIRVGEASSPTGVEIPAGLVTCPGSEGSLPE